jgi:hypothetical protein
MKHLILTLAGFVILCLVADPVAAKKRRRVQSAWGAATVYSNLSLEPETGDVGGIEVVLIPAYGGDWASVVEASGIAYDPVLVRVERDGMRIKFTLPATRPDEQPETFVGTITRRGLLLRNENSGAQLLRKQCR